MHIDRKLPLGEEASGSVPTDNVSEPGGAIKGVPLSADLQEEHLSALAGIGRQETVKSATSDKAFYALPRYYSSLAPSSIKYSSNKLKIQDETSGATVIRRHKSVGGPY